VHSAQRVRCWHNNETHMHSERVLARDAGPTKWEDLGNPAVGEGPKGCNPECQGANTTFNSQSTFVLPLATGLRDDEGQQHDGAAAAVALWMGDRWYPDETYAKEPKPLLQHNATYVWLNIVPGPSPQHPLVMKWEGDITPGKPA
jgi:hypothetical protein